MIEEGGTMFVEFVPRGGGGCDGGLEGRTVVVEFLFFKFISLWLILSSS